MPHIFRHFKCARVSALQALACTRVGRRAPCGLAPGAELHACTAKCRSGNRPLQGQRGGGR